MLPVHARVHELLQGQVYLVGGAVRDYLLGADIKDYDFATPLPPDEIEARVRAAGMKPYLVGKRFGTVGCKVQLDSGYEYVEITTYRTEEYTPGSRKPVVEYTDSLEADLSRRDLTINAMAMGVDGGIIDPFGGREDLDNKLIRAVGSPKLRFKEDPLRLLRTVRFAARYGAEIEETTYTKLCRMKFLLLNIARERWTQELDKILAQADPRLGLELLQDSGLLGIMIPSLALQVGYDQNSPYHDFELWEHTVRVVCGVPADNLDLRWAALLHDIAKPYVRTRHKSRDQSHYLSHDLLGASMARDVASRLRFSKARTEYIVAAIETHLEPGSLLKLVDDAGKKIDS